MNTTPEQLHAATELWKGNGQTAWQLYRAKTDDWAFFCDFYNWYVRQQILAEIAAL